MPRTRIEAPRKVRRLTATSTGLIKLGPTPMLTHELMEDICRQVRIGLPFDAICDLFSVSSRAMWEWRRRGEKFLNGDGEPKDWAIYAEFLVNLRRSFAQYRRGLIKKVHKNSPGWVQFLAILERRDRDNFGRFGPQGGGEEQYDPDERFD